MNGFRGVTRSFGLTQARALGRLFFLCALIGVIAGVGAIAFHFLLNLSSAASQVGSGVIYATGGFGAMNLTAAALALIPLALALWWQVGVSRKD